MLQSPSIRLQIDALTLQGNHFLSEASKSGDQAAYLKAIQEFASSYKFALLLNSKDGTEQVCAFNLGAAHIAGGDTSRGIALLQTILDHAVWPQSDEQPHKNAYQGDVHFNLATGYEKLSDSDNAMKNYMKALLQYDLEEDGKKVGETHLKIANIFNSQKEFSDARRNFEHATKIYSKLGDKTNAVIARICQANTAVLDRTCSREERIKLLSACCNDCAELSSKGLQGKILCEVGLLYSKLGYLRRALLCFEKSVILCEPAHVRRKALSLQNAGAILNTLGRYEEAIPRHSQSAQLHGGLTNRNEQGQSFCNLAFAYSQLGLFEESGEAYLHALKAFEDTDDRQGQWQCHEGLGAVAFNNGRMEKAAYHFNMALSCQTEAIDDGSRKRVLYKLTNVLKMGRLKPNNVDKPLAIGNGTENDTKTPSLSDTTSKDSSSDEDVVDNKPTIPSAKPRRNTRRRKTEDFQRGRRQYSDKNDRPIRHIARGISNLSAFSNPYAESQTIVLSGTDSDIPEFLSDVNTFARPPSSMDSSVHRDKKTMGNFHKQPSRRQKLRGLVQTSVMPINALTVAHDGDKQTPEPYPRVSYEQELITNRTTESAASDKMSPRNETSSSVEDVKDCLRQQLTRIDEDKSEADEQSMTSVTSVSSSSSSSSSKSNRRHGTIPKRVASKSSEAGPYVNDNLANAPSLAVPSSDGETLNSTHLYASVKTAKRNTTSITKDDTLHASGTIYEKIPENTKDQNSGDDIPPLLSAHSSRNAENTQEAADGVPVISGEDDHIASSNLPVNYSMSPTLKVPEPPPRITPPTSSKKKKTSKEKTAQSSACTIM